MIHSKRQLTSVNEESQILCILDILGLASCPLEHAENAKEAVASRIDWVWSPALALVAFFAPNNERCDLTADGKSNNDLVKYIRSLLASEAVQYMVSERFSKEEIMKEYDEWLIMPPPGSSEDILPGDFLSHVGKVVQRFPAIAFIVRLAACSAISEAEVERIFSKFKLCLPPQRANTSTEHALAQVQLHIHARTRNREEAIIDEDADDHQAYNCAVCQSTYFCKVMHTATTNPAKAHKRARKMRYLRKRRHARHN